MCINSAVCCTMKIFVIVSFSGGYLMALGNEALESGSEILHGQRM